MEDWNKYLAEFDEEKQRVTLRVLEIAEKYIPNARRVMSYGVPTLKNGDKSIIAVAPAKNHFSIYPFGGDAIEAVKGKIPKNAEFSKGTIRFNYENTPSEEIIREIVKFKLRQEN